MLMMTRGWFVLLLQTFGLGLGLGKAWPWEKLIVLGLGYQGLGLGLDTNGLINITGQATKSSHSKETVTVLLCVTLFNSTITLCPFSCVPEQTQHYSVILWQRRTTDVRYLSERLKARQRVQLMYSRQPFQHLIPTYAFNTNNTHNHYSPEAGSKKIMD